ncbi:MAG: RHS repeat-associated core domain-containing protein, partial [bacterium]
VGFSAPVAPTAPSGTTQRAAVNSAASLLVTDRYQSRPATTSALSASSSLPANSASITVALVPLTTVGRYGYPGHDDNPQFTKNTSGGFIDMTIGLVGNTAYVVTASGINYSHANLHGDAVTVTNSTGNRIWTGFTGPFGESIGTAPPNTNLSGTSWRWHGGDQRVTDRSIIHMGARPYSPVHGRFLAVDPIEGGCANDYVYVHGDPGSQSDLTGLGFWSDLWRGARCVSYRFIGIAPPGPSERHGKGGRGSGSEGWEVNSRRVIENVATQTWQTAATLAAKRFGPKLLAKGIPVVGWIEAGLSAGKAIWDCRDQF